MTAKIRISMIVNWLIIIAAAVGLGMMLFARGGAGAAGAAAVSKVSIWDTGFGSLKYFSVLANMLAIVASVRYFTSLTRALSGKSDQITQRAHVFKYISACTLGLCLLSGLLYLSPRLGFENVMQGPRLWLDIVTPLLALGEFIFLDHGRKLPVKQTFLAMIPAVVYGIFYIIFSLATGRDWYGFYQLGVPMGILTMAISAVISWGIAIGVRFANEIMRKRI